MTLNLNIDVHQIIGLISQLPDHDKVLIKNEISNSLKCNSLNSRNDDLIELLLDGPVMTKEEEQRFLNFNDEFNKWTNKIKSLD